MARICVVRQGYFSVDPRVRREVDTLAALGHEVDVLCLPRPGDPRFERQGPVTIRRLPLPKLRGGAFNYLVGYVVFLLVATVAVAWLHLTRRYHLVQVNTLPDFLVFAAVVPRLTGARVLLDLHECMPEFCATKFGLSLKHPLIRLVGWVEQASIRFAHHAITCSEQMREAFIARGTPPDRLSVVLNGSDEKVFDVRRFPPRQRQPGRFSVICHGSIEERYGLDTTIEAVALLGKEIPGLELKIYGEGSYLEPLRALVRQRGIEDRVWLSGRFVPMDELLAAIADSDVGVVAMKRDAFRDLTLCNKMYDYVAMRRPAIVSRTRSVEESFPEGCFLLFDSRKPAELADALRELYADPGLADRLVEAAARGVETHRWPHQREVYARVIARLLGAGAAPGRDSPQRLPVEPPGGPLGSPAGGPAAREQPTPVA